MMEITFAPLALLFVVGLVSLIFGRASRFAHALGSLGAAAGCLFGLIVVIIQLFSGVTGALSLPWNTALGASFTIGFDALTGVFLLPLYLIGGLSAVFGAGYLTHTSPATRRGSHWFFYCILIISMALVMLARNAVLFLIVWETMSLSSWMLVTFEHEKAEVRRAGITYLVATQIGTAFLIVLFLVLGSASNPIVVFGAPDAALDFSRFGGLTAPAAGVAFLLALVGFGTKAGIVPLHIWLPEAHPAAPSHVSALMSGVMIKTGIYGILRILSFLGAPPAWWGWTVLVVGASSGVIGVLFALAQHDIKRLLAYHSVENIGIICIGIGVGMLGLSYGSPLVAMLGFAGGILHVLNHAIFKGLLFLGAGAVTAATGTREMDRLGGLLRRMPLTGGAFLIASIAICGLPPLNGFVSEFLILSGAFRAIINPIAATALAGTLASFALALISGLAAACFAKAFGIVFLGEPRLDAAAGAREQGMTLVIPMLVLAALCVVIGLLAAPVVMTVAPLAAALAGLETPAALGLVAPLSGILWNVIGVAAGVMGLAGVLALVRFLLQRHRTRVQTGTWDCGYVNPSPRMQYTSSSFAQPLVGMFRGLLSPHRRLTKIDTPFPTEAGFSTETPDAFSQRIFLPGIRHFAGLLSRMRWLQHGRLQLYVLYIAVTVVVLFVWRFA
jgi:hydrogenase-4 component B